jgi:hypothetical protein
LLVLVGLLGTGEIGLGQLLYIFGTVGECEACREGEE